MLIGYTTDAWMQLSKCQQDRDTFSYLESFDGETWGDRDL